MSSNVWKPECCGFDESFFFFEKVFPVCVVGVYIILALCWHVSSCFMRPITPLCVCVCVKSTCERCYNERERWFPCLDGGNKPWCC